MRGARCRSLDMRGVGGPSLDVSDQKAVWIEVCQRRSTLHQHQPNVYDVVFYAEFTKRIVNKSAPRQAEDVGATSNRNLVNILCLLRSSPSTQSLKRKDDTETFCFTAWISLSGLLNLWLCSSKFQGHTTGCMHRCPFLLF